MSSVYIVHISTTHAKLLGNYDHITKLTKKSDLTSSNARFVLSKASAAALSVRKVHEQIMYGTLPLAGFVL